jgi:PAS domain S-box-containing protein
MSSAADDGSTASLRPVLTDPRIQSLAGLGDLLIYRTDIASGETVWTPALLRQWGYEVGAVGQHQQWWLERTHPDDVAILTRFLDEALSGEREQWGLAYRFRRADGSWAWVEGRARILRDAAGHPVATEGVVRDSSRIRAAEAALRKSEEHFRLLTEHARELVCRHDADGTYRYVSPAITELTQWAPDDLLGRTPYEFFHPDDHARIAAEAHATALQGDLVTIGMQYRFRCKDGTYRWLETLTRPLLDESNTVIGLQTSSRDVTDRRQAEQMLMKTQKLDAIGHLASGVAHEFNNLLTVTSANLDLLLATPHDEHTHALLAESLTATTGAAVLTRQLMTLGRRELPRREAVDITALLERLSPMLRRLAGPRTTLQVGAAPDMWVKGSATQLEQVLLNLVANARDALRDRLDIAVRAESVVLAEPLQARVGTVPAGSWVCLRVEDTGMGIPDAVLDHILEPFYTTKPAGTGLGLGLPTIVAILTDLGGTLTVSTTEGHGTTVTCWLPPCARPASATAVGPTARGRSQRRAGCRVLLVDDEPAVLKVAHRVLMTLGFDVTPAASAAEALSNLGSGPPPDVMLTDVTMPEMSGPELVRRVHELMPSLPVAFMSGYAREDLLQQGQIGEEYPLVHKPFVAADLCAALERLCPHADASTAEAVAL